MKNDFIVFNQLIEPTASLFNYFYLSHHFVQIFAIKKLENSTSLVYWQSYTKYNSYVFYIFHRLLIKWIKVSVVIHNIDTRTR